MAIFNHNFNQFLPSLLKGARAVSRSAYGVGEGPILFDDVECSGSEQMLVQCPHGGISNHNCLPIDIAGVVCSPTSNATIGKQIIMYVHVLRPDHASFILTSLQFVTMVMSG